MAWNGSEKFVPKYVQTKPKEEKKQVSSFYDDFQTRRAENSKSIGEKNPVTKAVSKSKTSNSKKSATTSQTDPKSDLKFYGGYQSYADRKKNGRVFTPSTVLGRKMSEPAPITKLDGLTDELNTKLNKIVDDYYDIRNNKNLSATEFNQAISDLMKNNSGALDEFAKQSGMPRDKVTIPGLQYRFKEQRKKDYQTKLNTAYENRVKRHYDLGNREDFFAVVNSALPEEKRVAENRVEKVFSNAEFVNPSDLHEYESARLPDYYGPQSGVHSKVKGVDDSDVNLLYMTEYERLIYKYYLKKYGVKEADEYIKDIEIFLDKRRTDAHSTITHKYSNDHKALGVLSDVIYSMAQFPAYLDAGVQSIVQDNSTLQNYRPYNPYTEATQAVHGQSAAREGVTQDMSTVGKGVTNLGLGVAENVARLPLGVTGLPLMGLNVAGQSTVDRGLKGETDAGKAFQTGTTKGTIEMATEWLPLDNVLKVMKSPPSTAKEAVVTVLKNAGIEGTEEAISNIAGNISDKVINGDTSDFERYKQGLMEQGMSEGEALTKAFWEYYVVDTIEAGGQGFLSGLVMNTGATTAGYVNNTIETGRAINDSGGGQAVVDAGLKRHEATDANKYAQKMRAKQENGEDISNWNAGRQFQKNVQAFKAEGSLANSIRERLGIDVKESLFLADSKGNALNGRYDGNNRIDISKNGDASAPATLGHEVLHYLRNNAPDVYNQMKSYVSEMILNDEDNGFKERYKHHRKNYKYSPDVAIEEVVADLAESMFGKKSSIDSMVKNNPKMVQSVLDGIKSTKAKIKDKFLAPNTNRTGLKQTYAQLDKFERMYYDGLRKASQNKGNVVSGEARGSYLGKNKDGIEVYETSPKIKQMSYSDRMQKFIDIMEHRYSGRTAKFNRNGHVYYARFESDDILKNVYGDKRSDLKGWKAKINTGADGDIFEVVENAVYNRSEPEKGKSGKIHQTTNYWDYFVKKVQIDNKVFDLVANIRKDVNNQYVYSLQLNEDTKTVASPPLGRKSIPLNRVLNTTASDNNISQPNPVVKTSGRSSLAGEHAKTANFEELQKAMAMDEKGIDAKIIWQETGWGKGQDGLWRFEIDDSEAEYIGPDFEGLHHSFKLSEVLKHDKLYEAYPELKNLPVGIGSSKAGLIDGNGSYAPISNLIFLDKDLSNEEKREVLLHEAQHAIQVIENFAVGADYKEDGEEKYWRSAGELEARDVKSRADMTMKERRNTFPESMEKYTGLEVIQWRDHPDYEMKQEIEARIKAEKEKQRQKNRERYQRKKQQELERKAQSENGFKMDDAGVRFSVAEGAGNIYTPNRVARRLIDDYDAKGNVYVKDVQDSVTALARKVNDVFGSDDVETKYPALEAEARVLAEQIIGASKNTNSYQKAEYDNLRKWLKDSRIKITDELKNDIPDFNDYRKRLMGTVYFSNDGTPIDILYKDLQEQFPQYFDEQEQTTQSDQLTHLVDVIQNLKQFETGIADDDYDNMVDELKDRIILDAMNLSSYIQPELVTQSETESVPEMATDSEAEMPMPPIEAYEEPPEYTNRTQRGRQDQYNEVNAQQKVQDLMREQGVSSPSELSPDTVTREQSKKDRNIFRGRQGIRNFMSRAYTLVVDDMHPFWNYNKAYEKVSSQTNYGKENPYKLAINAKDASSRSAYIVSDKMVDFDNNEVGEGLVNTITNGGITEKNYNDFNNYLVARHALEWLDPDEHGSFKNVYENPALNDVDVVSAMVADFEHKNPEFKQAAENLYEWQRQLMQTWLVDTGVITQEQYNRFTEMYPDYVPFFREQNVQMSRNATGGFANQGNLFKQAVGTQERRILQPIENIMYNVASYVNHATKHAVTSSAVRLYDILESDPENNVLRQYWEEVEPVNPDNGKPQYFRTKDSDSVDIQDVTQEEENSISQTLREQMGVQDGVVTIIDNGRKRYFRVNDADFLTVLDNVKPKMRDGFLSIMASFSRTRAALITSWNPAFSLASNPMRDFGTLITNSSDANKAKVVKEALSAYVDVAKSSEAYKQYLSMGGQYSSVTTEGMDAMKLAMQKLKAKDPNMAKRFFKLFPKMFNGYQTISDAIESAPRMSEFKTTLDKGYDFHEAFFRAKDVTTNFSRGGKIAKDINSISNFFNASIQGVDKFFRQAKNNPKSFAIGVSCLAAIELLAWAWNTAGDDEEKEEAYDNLSNYTKNNFYNFYIGGGEFISIPKARESAVLATSIGATLNSMVNEQADRFKGFFSEYIKSQFIPDWSLVGYSTYKDLSSNKDYLGRPIISAELKKLPNELQYDDDTSYFAKWLGGVIKQSPKQIDHIINSEAGVLGKVNRTYFSPSGQQDKATMFTFGVNTTFNKDSLFSTDHPTFFYNNKEEAEKQANGYPSADNGYLSNRYYQAGSVMGILNEIYKEDTESDAGREMRRAYVNYAKEYKKNPMGLSDDVYNEIKDLYDANADALKMPTVQRELKMKIGKENKSFVFSDAESVINYQKDLNKGVDEAYRKLLSDVSYNAMSDLEKAEALNDARADATKAVKKFYIENEGKKRMYTDDGSTSIAEPSKADIDQYKQKMKHQEEVTGYLQTIADNVAKAVPDKADDYSVSSMQINDIQSAKIDGKSYKISGDVEKKVIDTANDVHYSNIEKLMNNEINVEDVVGYTSKGKARTSTQADGTKVQLTGKLYNDDGTPRFDEVVMARIMYQSKETAKDQAIEQYKDEITGSATPTFTPTPTSNTSSTKVSSNTTSSGERRRFTSAKASGGSSSKATTQTGNKVRFTGRASTTPTRSTQMASAHLPNVVTPKAVNTDIMQQAVNSFMKNSEIKPIQPLKNPLTM